jgi:hypothetical protein
VRVTRSRATLTEVVEQVDVLEVRGGDMISLGLGLDRSRRLLNGKLISGDDTSYGLVPERHGDRQA